MIIRNIYWYTSDGMRQTKKLVDVYNTILKDIILLSKNKLTIQVGFPTGHCRLCKHVQGGVSSNETCRFWVYECEAVARRTLRHLGVISRSKITLNDILPIYLSI